MREIKFRYMWQGKMQYVTMLEIIRQIGFEYGIPENILYLTQPKIWDTETNLSELMQYTGLQDKNGKEIYEGDILDCIFYDDFHTRINWKKTDIAARVYWDLNGFGLVGINKVGDKRYPNFVDINLKKSEVIGSIYENPELLK